VFRQIGSPDVLHVATHGFYIAPAAPDQQTNTDALHGQIDPLLHTGLVMAGANRYWPQDSLATEQDNGISTALEISQMDLGRTQLAVLSACQTGLGTVDGSEGVYGLQRAFRIAGVRHLIMSLWAVPDRETAVFMQTFYNNWTGKGLSIERAFSKTQRYMRRRYDTSIWGAWVLMH
jgi:CHAT domain-containing protein